MKLIILKYTRPFAIGLLTLLLSLLSFGGDLTTIDQKFDFLTYLRRTHSNIYESFVVRFDTVDFLNDLQLASDKVHSNIPKVSGTGFTIHEVAEGKSAFGSIDSEKFENQFSDFLRTYPKASGHNLESALVDEMKLAFLYEGLQGSLFQLSHFPNAKQFLKMSYSEQIENLNSSILQMPVLEGFNPRKLGLNQDSISGSDFIKLYQNSYQARENAYHLLTLSLFIYKTNGNLNVPVSQLSESLLKLNSQSYIPLLDQETFSKTSVELANYLSGHEADKTVYPLKFFIKTAKASYDYLKQIGLSNVSVDQPVLMSERGHPYEVSLRGLFGDCASTNSSVVPYAQNEEVDWLRKPGGPVKGYMQYTLVSSEGEKALYVHTISGASISRYDARNALLGLFETLSETGATKIILPVPEKLFFIINYPEVEIVFRNLIAQGKRVPITYGDAGDRANLMHFTEGSLDLPETNQFGIEISKATLLSKNLYVTKQKVEVKKEDLFKTPTPEEILLISLELQHHEKNNPELHDFLVKRGISIEAFDALRTDIKNPGHLPVAEFHSLVQKRIQNTGIAVHWAQFLKSNVFYEGHFAAPDAVHAQNFELSMNYITNFVLSYSSFDFVYSSLTPHFAQLVQQPEFAKLVRLIFRRNLKETNRILDFYELQSESAFRTLANLFKAGLPVQSFQAEIDQLEAPLENSVEDVTRRDGAFFRRISLLGAIHNYSPQYFEQMIARLESLALSGTKVDSNDMRVAAQFLANYLASTHLTPEQNNQIYHFLTTSDFGHLFAPEMAVFRLENLNVPGYFDALMKANQPKWAAHLIHKKAWTLHSLAPEWVSRMWERKDEIGFDTFLYGFSSTPEWLNVQGIDSILDGLLNFSRRNLADEDLMMELLLKKKEPLTQPQLAWLAEVTTPDLAKEVIKRSELVLPKNQFNKMKKHLEMRFPERTADLHTAPINKSVKVINVFSGAPQHTDTPTKYAGFGDIAVNLVAAVEMKTRYPDKKVRLLVTGANHRYDPLIPTTAEIMKIMVPSLNPELKGISQNYEGIEVIFVDYDFANILSEENEDRAPELMKDVLEKLPRILPHADLNLNYSYFPGSSELITMNAPVAMGIEENYDADKIVGEVIKTGRLKSQGTFIELTSGPRSAGFMLTHELEQKHAVALIHDWTQHIGFRLDRNEDQNPLIAYTSEWQGTQAYIDAISAMNMTEPALLVVKDFADLDISNLPKNVKVLKAKGIPHEVVRALIQESKIAPLVTGDTSFGQALSSVRPSKTFVYEAPDWKLDSARATKQALTTDLGLSKQALLPMFLNANTLKKLDRKKIKLVGQRLGKFLADNEMQRKIYTAIQARARNSWDLIDNTLEIASRTYEMIQANGQNTNLTREHEKVSEAMGDIREDLFMNRAENPFSSSKFRKRNMTINSCQLLFN